MPNVKKTISIPEPLHDFAMKQSRRLMKREKGEDAENLSMFVTELIREAKEKLEPSRKAA